MADHSQYFNWPEIECEAKARLEQEYEVNRAWGEVDLQKSRVEYWTAVCAHANVVACLTDGQGGRTE